ncbi:unnamed protein product [Cyprideis torosa]|uniref:Uncharacterized protein n=1 Tax=Cyprideis torosa TaxID=163714 RepID=A0A7R8WQS4_9CRUS|nr:unnamed protein product [Cyprideis torosa]CAG0906339.1 unnamed protein product [Cyprideis torosa]
MPRASGRKKVSRSKSEPTAEEEFEDAQDSEDKWDDESPRASGRKKTNRSKSKPTAEEEFEDAQGSEDESDDESPRASGRKKTNRSKSKPTAEEEFEDAQVSEDEGEGLVGPNTPVLFRLAPTHYGSVPICLQPIVILIAPSFLHLSCSFLMQKGI